MDDNNFEVDKWLHELMHETDEDACKGEARYIAGPEGRRVRGTRPVEVVVRKSRKAARK